MFKTVLGIAAGAFLLKRVSPETYKKVVTVADDFVSTGYEVSTAVCGQIRAYSAEACKDAEKRLAKADPQAIVRLRAMLEGKAQSKVAASANAQPKP